MNKKAFLKAAVGVIAAPFVVKEVKAGDFVEFVLPGSLEVPPLKFKIPKRTQSDQEKEGKLQTPILGQMYYRKGNDEGLRFFNGLKWHKISQPS